MNKSIFFTKEEDKNLRYILNFMTENKLKSVTLLKEDFDKVCSKRLMLPKEEYKTYAVPRILGTGKGNIEVTVDYIKLGETESFEVM